MEDPDGEREESQLLLVARRARSGQGIATPSGKKSTGSINYGKVRRSLRPWSLMSTTTTTAVNNNNNNNSLRRTCIQSAVSYA